MEKETVNIPSLHRLVCPKCHQKNLSILGTDGSKSAISKQLLFGAIGNLVANENSKNDFSLHAIRYKCNACGNKFEATPLTAEPDEILDTPCRITFTRLSSLIGLAVAQHVWLNGIKVAVVGNGKTVTFETLLKYNTVFVTDQYGTAFKGDFKFEAQSGGCMDIRFKRKFL